LAGEGVSIAPEDGRLEDGTRVFVSKDEGNCCRGRKAQSFIGDFKVGFSGFSKQIL
jgi:hypothetical protein